MANSKTTMQPSLFISHKWFVPILIDFSNTDGLGGKIHAPPGDGEANTELLKYLSKILGVKKSSMAIRRGSNSRNKVISITDTSLITDDVKGKIDKELSD